MQDQITSAPALFRYDAETELTITSHDADGFHVPAPQVARALGFRQALDLTRGIPDAEKGYELVRTPGGEQHAAYLTESGFYRALGQRQAARITEPAVRARVEGFQAWVYGTVLPQIRRTGSYGSATVDTLTPLEYARKLVDAEERAVAEAERRARAETRLAVEQKRRAAIEGGDGINLTDFGKKFFSEVPARKFDEHLYRKGWLINQLGTRAKDDGTKGNGHDHRKPTAKGRPFIYEHDTGNHGGKRRFQPRVRPQREIELRDALAAEGLPVNTHSTGLVLITNDEMKELGA